MACLRSLLLVVTLSLCSYQRQVADAFDAKVVRVMRDAAESVHHVPITDRRSALAAIIGAGITANLVPTSALASDDLYLAQPLGPEGDSSSRPSAPVEYLLPAARVGLYIYQTLAIAEELARLQSRSSDTDAQQKVAEDIAKLDALLLSSPSFIKPNDPNVKRGDPYNSLPIVGEIGVAAQKQKERQERSIDVGFAPRFFEVGNLIGERRQWNQLQKSERAREGVSEVRRAFNIYTTNLSFNQNKYEWKGSKEEKSKLIRNDKLPTTTDVIRSDLDARDLYRNKVQEILEDARAEYLYQKKESSISGNTFDVTELLGLLKDAQGAVDSWFSFIQEDDVKEALEAARREQA